jgi:hypothetical protein
MSVLEFLTVTSDWQVGDSTEQNGCFKMALTKFKRELLKRKESVDFEFAIQKDDVVPIVSRAWGESFARVQSNRKAIAERGWGPLNYNCLLHPEILSTRHPNDKSGHDIPAQQHQQLIDTDHVIFQERESRAHAADELNTSGGTAGNLITEIIEARVRDDARNGVNLEENRRKRQEAAQEAINSKKKRFSTGLMVAAGVYNLAGDQVLRNIEERAHMTQELESSKQEKGLKAYRSLRVKVDAVRALSKQHEELNVSQLRTMVMWYKHRSDLATPLTRPLLLTRLLETCHRGDPREPIIPCLVPATMQEP